MLETISDRLSRDESWTQRTQIPCHTCGEYVYEDGLERVVINEDNDIRRCIDICPLCLADPRNIQGYVAEHLVEAIEAHENDF